MRTRIWAIALVSLQLTAGVGMAQTPEIQKKVEKKLGELRKEKSALEDLLTLALKNNADIRVAESKLRDAEMSLYRTRMQILEKVAMLYHESRAAKAAADEARARSERDKQIYDKNGLSAAELSASYAAMEKFKYDYDRFDAQMDFLTGRNNQQNAVEKSVLWLLESQFAKPKQAKNADPPPNPIPEAMAAKILKVLETPTKVPVADSASGAQVLDILREHAKGINILGQVANPDVEAKLQLKEAIPLGALFQWAEDQFNWRFVIRDYGIVATDRDNVPPAGAVLLLDFWRKSKGPDSAQ
jgi:hypothetical protein